MEAQMIVSQVMSRSVETCRPADSLSVAAQKMWDRDVGCLPVVDDGGHLVGAVTDRDVCMAAFTQGRSLDALRVETAMTHGAYTCAPGDGVDIAVAVMRARQVRRLPVIDAGRLVGLVSLGDLALESAQELGRLSPDLDANDIVSALAAISEPRIPADAPSSAHVFQSRPPDHGDEFAVHTFHV
jgi:CBS domain-containing protein